MAKTKEKPNKISSRVFIEYNEDKNGGELKEPDNQWSSRTETNIDVKFIRAHKEQPKLRFFYDSVEVDERYLQLDALYLIVVRYSTGNTFGHTEGAWHIVNVAPTYKTAELILEEALESKTGYKPWEGYFERFTSSEIHKLDLV